MSEPVNADIVWQARPHVVQGAALAGYRTVASDSLVRVLVAATARALRDSDCGDLGHPWALTRLRGAPEPVRRAAVARAAGRSALTFAQLDTVDAEEVARWVVAQYPAGPFPGVVVGSPHGGAVHLAVALGMPWFPSAFDVSVAWPGGAADRPREAYAHGTSLAERLLARNPDLHVRQLHCPASRGALAASTMSYVLRWQRLPEAYRRFLAGSVIPGAAVLLVRDTRTWPVLDEGRGHSFQVGCPASGLDPADFRAGSQALRQVLRSAGADGAAWDPTPESGVLGSAEHAVEPGFELDLREWVYRAGGSLHRVLFPEPWVLGAAVADLYRGWLRRAGKTGDRCVVECGRVLDPWQVVRAGMVPYWCENATRRTVEGVEWWLAGSEPFSSVDVLPEPPGVRSPALAGLPQWLAVAAFGRRRRVLDRMSARGYPASAVPTRRATEVLRNQASDLPAPSRLSPGEAVAALRDGGRPHGLLVC